MPKRLFGERYSRAMECEDPIDGIVREICSRLVLGSEYLLHRTRGQIQTYHPSCDFVCACQFTNIGNYIANPATMKVAAISAGILSPTVVPYLVAAIDLFDGLLILVPTKRVGPLCLDRLYRTHDRFRAQFLDDGRRGAPGQSSSLLQESRPHRWPCAWIGGRCWLDHRFSKS
jgi:hypothetical protein